MAQAVKNRVYETTSTTGTGSFTLTGAVDASFRTFGAVMANGDTCRYVAFDATGLVWEEGIGTWGTGGVLARTSVEEGSSGTSPVNFTTAPKVFMAAEPPSGSHYLNGVLQSGNPNALPRVDVFTSSSSITKHPLARRIMGRLIGGGGGGGSGASAASTSTAPGGGGGGGGGYNVFDLPASAFASSIAVTFTANSGAGAAGVTGASGGTGQDGATVSIAAISSIGPTNVSVYAYGGKGGGGGVVASTGTGGNGGGILAQGTLGFAGLGNTNGGGAGTSFGGGGGGGGCPATAAGGGGGSGAFGAPAGGGGGGWTSAGSSANGFGGTGGNSPYVGFNSGPGLAQAGTAGTNSPLDYFLGGGGSGGSSGAGAGYPGGVGGSWGGGGGGGSGSQPATQVSGAGGQGGPAVVYVVQS